MSEILKRPKSRSLRAREDQDSDGSSDPIKPSRTQITKLKNKQRSKPKATLSFGGDDNEEGDVQAFVLNKVRSSGYIPTSNVEASVSPGYSQAYLSELKASTPSTPPVHVPNEAETLDASEIEGALIENHDLFDTPMAGIPSSSAIIAAKERRERLRAISSDDYISLTMTRRDEMPQGPHPESRLMREDDILGEGEEDMAEYTGATERIALGKEAKKVEAKKRRQGIVELIEDVAEDDEETQEWERAQIRRAGRVDNTVPQKKSPKTYQAAAIPTSTQIPTLSAAINRLSLALTSVTTSHTTNSTSLTKLVDEMDTLNKQEVAIRESIDKAEEKRAWFASFRERLEGIAAFLDEKFQALEQLEQEHVSLIKERYEILNQRRLKDDEDDIVLFLRPAEMGDSRVDTPASLGILYNVPVRQEQRHARVARRALRCPTSADEGYSTDSSLLSSDANDFDLAMQNLSMRINDVLSDVQADDFRDPRLGLSKWFSIWRLKWPESYTSAWGGLGLVAAWEFWTRLEVAAWDPLNLQDSRNLHDFEWYSAIYEYSRLRSRNSGSEQDILGPDGDLVGAMISSAIVPRIAALVEAGALNPYSVKQITRMIDISEQVEASLEQNSPKFKLLLGAVLTPFKRAIDSTVYLLGPSLTSGWVVPPSDSESSTACKRFLNRQIKLLLALMKWRMYVGENSGVAELVTKIITKIAVPVVECTWEIGGSGVAQKIVQIVPVALLPKEFYTRTTGKRE